MLFIFPDLLWFQITCASMPDFSL